MIDEDKQQESTSQPTDEPIDSQGMSDPESAATEGDLTDLESQSNEFEQPNAESSPVSAQTPDGQEFSEQATQAAPEIAAELGDLAALDSLRQDNEALKAQVEDITQQFDALKTQSMRMAADFDNFRKRTAKEKEELEQQLKRVTISELLPVIDNFERARSQIKPQNDGEMAIHKSYQGVYKQLVDCLKRIGVSAMRPEGQEFDPNLHEAVMREPTHEYPEGVVIEQLQRGYFLGDRVLRHAMVKVATAPETPSEESSENQDASSE
jgi:molecular chaperone GrpE